MENVRNKTIRFRVNQAEYDLIQERANGSVSDWLRALALDQKPKKQAKPFDKKLLYQLNKIGVNLNQIAKASNSTFGKIDHALLLGALADIHRELIAIRTSNDS